MEMKQITCIIVFTVGCISWVASGQLAANYLPPSQAFPAGSLGAKAGSRHNSAQPQLLYQAASSHHAAQFVGSNLAGAATRFAQHGIKPATQTQVPILRNDFVNYGNGNYNFGYETQDGIRRDEKGEFKGGWPHGSQSVTGSYSYVGDDGRVYTVNYKADSNGFHAEGAHLPKPPNVRGNTPGGRSAVHHGGTTYGGHVAAAGSNYAPTTQYLPPLQKPPHQQQQQQLKGYNYARLQKKAVYH